MTTTSLEVRGRRSAMPLKAGKVVSSTTRKRSRVIGAPVVLVNVLRMSMVPKSGVICRIRGQVTHIIWRIGIRRTEIDRSDVGQDSIGHSRTAKILWSRGAKSLSSTALFPLVSTKMKSAALSFVSCG